MPKRAAPHELILFLFTGCTRAELREAGYPASTVNNYARKNYPQALAIFKAGLKKSVADVRL